MPTLANLIFGAGNPLALLFNDSSSSSDNSEDWIDINEDKDAYDIFANPLEGMRLPRTRMTYCHDGDMLANMDGTSEDATNHWSNLRAAVLEEKWMTEFRMSEALFEELLALVQPHMDDSRVYIDGRRTYAKRHSLLLTLSFLAHFWPCHTFEARVGSVDAQEPDAFCGELRLPVGN